MVDRNESERLTEDEVRQLRDILSRRQKREGFWAFDDTDVQVLTVVIDNERGREWLWRLAKKGVWVVVSLATVLQLGKDWVARLIQ